MSKFSKGAKNAVKCLDIKEKDRILIITDDDTRHIAEAVKKEIINLGVDVIIFRIEKEIGNRPVKLFPALFKKKILEFSPNVSFYIAKGKKGELENFRMPLLDLLTNDLKCRHGHMINIDDKLMLEGMSADYDKIYRITNTVYDMLKDSKKIEVEARETKLRVLIDNNLKWKVCDGRIEKPGDWSNLPEGEVFTCPKSVDGVIAAFVVGDYFSEKYGILEEPIFIEISKSVIQKINCKNKKLEEDFRHYVKKFENGDRVGEFAIGTLEGLKEFTGNLLQDEKYPGIHIAFGSPYPDDTGADWDCSTHVDLIPKNCTISVDDKKIMEKGTFVL